MGWSMIRQVMCARSVQTGNTNIPGRIIFSGMSEFITWTKTKMTLNLERSFRSDRKVLAEVDGVEVERPDVILS